jgi:hypothetical protein
MLKLFILDNLSAFSSDTVFKICLSLEEKGLQEENTEKFESYDDMFASLAVSLEDGDHVIIASENADYLSVKNALIPYFTLQGASNSSVAEAIAKNTTGSLEDIDMEDQCTSPIGATLLLSPDGLYSGFSTLVSNGRLTCLPLDFNRVDSMISSLVDQIISREETMAEMGVEGEIQMPDFDLLPTVTDMVNALYKSEKTMALCTGEATMWIYNLYDKVDYLTDSIKFAEIEPNSDTEEENESAAVIAKARDAMISVGSDFGGAISEIYSSYNDEGNITYYVFAAVVDSESANAKKINISDSANLSIILPHAVTLLSDMICKKLKAAEKATRKDPVATDPNKKEPIVVTPKMIGIIAGLLLVIIIPIVLVFNMIGGKEEPTTTTLPTLPPVQSTEPSTTNPFGPTQQGGNVFANPEEGATDVWANPTVAPQPSSKGLFTFYVFGYGHGVGMSQTGANYLANQGWTWAEILAHYYYNPGTSIIQGDNYPDTITYAGAKYDTREFLAKSLESEMGPSFHTEALKAQCVAIYTFAKDNKYNLNADATAFDKSNPSSTVYSIVDEVMREGFYIANNDGVALTPYHAMSAGKTTSYYNVWGKNSGTHVSYLEGGRKSYGDYLHTDYKSVYTITSDDLKKLIESNEDLKVKLSGDPSTWLTILTHDQAVREDIGYVSTINVGGMVLTGNDFRIKVMEGRIRSHCFALQYTPM